WLADSGTTSHIMKIKSALMDFIPLKLHKIRCKLKNVLYVLSASNNLVSMTCLDKEGGQAIIGNGRVTLKAPGGRVIAKVKLNNGLY
ncbi:hypothetical protein EDD22DRAFT_742692, partial [Suillus occidentalis]